MHIHIHPVSVPNPVESSLCDSVSFFVSISGNINVTHFEKLVPVFGRFKGYLGFIDSGPPHLLINTLPCSLSTRHPPKRAPCLPPTCPKCGFLGRWAVWAIVRRKTNEMRRRHRERPIKRSRNNFKKTNRYTGQLTGYYY